MKKWASLKNLKSRGTSEDLTRKSLKRQASSPYLAANMSKASSSLNRKENKSMKKTGKNIFSPISVNYTALKTSAPTNKSSHNRESNQQMAMDRSLSSKKNKSNHPTNTSGSFGTSGFSNHKAIKRTSKASWKENEKMMGALVRPNAISPTKNSNPFLKKKKLVYNYLAV